MLNEKLAVYLPYSITLPIGDNKSKSFVILKKTSVFPFVKLYSYLCNLR